MTCMYCNPPAAEDLLWADDRCRVILVGGTDFPGTCRVAWHAHVKEFTDLGAADRAHVMTVVVAVETLQRALLAPDKVNLASFGNAVPHLHWHVIPRYHDDSHFPEPTWGPVQRAAPARTLPAGFHAGAAARLAAALGPRTR